MPAALQKAESLARIAKEQGAPLSEFMVTLTLKEAFELLDYVGAGGMGWYRNHDELIRDIAVAKAINDPWGLLANFTLEGLEIASTEALH